ncbi:M24 family metallopeptidase [Streptomyces phaeochromogenes]
MDINAVLDRISEVSTGVELAGTAPPHLDFPLAEYALRYARVVALMDLAELDVLVLTSEQSTRYLSGYESFIWTGAGRWLPGSMVVTRDPAAARLVIADLDLGAAGGTSWAAAEPYATPQEFAPTIVDYVRKAVGPDARVGMELSPGSGTHAPIGAVQHLLNAFAPVHDAGALLSAVRMLKSPLEVDRLRTAAQAAVAGFNAALDKACAGTTEEELVCAITSTMYQHGAVPSGMPPFLNVVSGPERYPVANAPASLKPLAAGDTVFIDGGAPARGGYMSDLMRIAAVGEVGTDVTAWMDAAVAANAAMRAAARPGVKASELYEAGRAAYEERGLADFTGTVSGHGIGLEVWERPLIGPHDRDPHEDARLRPGMVLCVEPLLAPVKDGALQGLFCAEDTILITDDGAELLSEGLDRDLRRLP